MDEEKTRKKALVMGRIAQNMIVFPLFSVAMLPLLMQTFHIYTYKEDTKNIQQ